MNLAREAWVWLSGSNVADADWLGGTVLRTDLTSLFDFKILSA